MESASYLPPQDIPFEETTFRSYSSPFQTLNVERLLFNPLRGLTVVRRNAVLNGIFHGPTLYATTLTLLKRNVLFLQMEAFSVLEEGGDEGVADEHFGFGNLQVVVLQ